MDGRTVCPQPRPCALTRLCEASRLQQQLLAQAYQRICPEVRRAHLEARGRTPTVERDGGPSAAAHAAAGA